MSREQTKAAHYIHLLDEARCDGNWEAVPELIRKTRKHAPTRACLALTAEAEYAVIQASQTISPTARPETARPSTASSVQSSTIAKFIPRLLDAIDNERTYVEDEFQARVCLGWLHWHLGEPALAAGRLPKNIGQEFAQLDGTNKESVGWTKVCALKAAYIKGNSQVKTGAVADALETFESSLPIFTSISTTANHSSQLKTWAELYLTGFCMVSSQAVKSKTTSILETETLSAFRTWAKFWEAQTAKWVGGRAHGAEVSRRHVWKEYYVVLSNLLRDDLPFPTTSLTTTYSSSTKFHQHTELKRIETRYKALILAELQFPKAEEVNEEVEEFVELVMQNWRIICGSDWKDYDLGEGGAEAVSRNVLDTLYDAATKTFHSTPILRHLFTVHLAVADFELAYKAFDTYLEIVKKGKLRVEKTGESEPSLDNDEIVLGAASECIKSLCRYGTMDAAEKAHELGVYFETWLDKQHAAHTVNDDQDAQTNGRTSSAPQQFTPKVMALAWRCIGIAHAQWARFTYDAGSRTEIQIHALKCFRKALHPDFESQTDVDTLFALGTLLAERREISAAIEVVKVGLQPPKSTSTDNNITGSRAAPFSRERSLIPLWHLLALLLSARQEFMTAARACEGAFEQFQDPRNLFGDASLNTPYRSDHLRMNEKSTARLQGIVDDMNDFERENVLEVKMTQLSLIEILEGPDVAVNASEELLGLYARLFGDPRKDAVVQTRPETAALSPPKSSAGTIRSIKGSIFGRSNRSIRKTSRTTPPAAEKSSVAMRPQTSQTLASARGPSIQVTHENGSAGKQHHHLTKDPPQEKPGRTTSISKKRASGSARTRSTSAGKRSSEHTTTIVDGEKFFTPPVDAEHRDDWLEDGNPANAGSGAASVKNADLPRRLPSNAQSMPQREKSLKSSRNEAGNVQNNPLPRISPYSSSTSPVTRFPKDQEQRRRTSTLIKVWLLIAGFYRRARMYDDSRGAIEEAHKLAQKLELDVTNDITGHVTISNSGWGGGKSSGELLGDVFAERGYLALAESLPYPALSHFESSLTSFPDHPSAIVGLSNILLDIYNEDILPPPLIAPLILPSLPSHLSTPSASTLGIPASMTPLSSQPTLPLSSASLLNIPLGRLGISRSNEKDSLPPGNATPSSLSSLNPSTTKESSTAVLDRLAARDRAYGLLSMLTKLGTGWNYSEAWFALARAYELGGQVDRAKELLWWCVELEEGRAVRDWKDVVGGGVYVI